MRYATRQALPLVARFAGVYGALLIGLGTYLIFRLDSASGASVSQTLLDIRLPIWMILCSVGGYIILILIKQGIDKGSRFSVIPLRHKSALGHLSAYAGTFIGFKCILELLVLWDGDGSLHDLVWGAIEFGYFGLVLGLIVWDVHVNRQRIAELRVY